MLPDHFWDKVQAEPNSGCWLWEGSLSHNGYASMGFNGKTSRAHRVAYEILVGPIPKDLQLDHLCRVRNCVNPEHLEPVTDKENKRRSPFFHKTHCKHGHRLSDGNTYICTRGYKKCRICIARNKERQCAKQALDKAA